MDTITLQKLAAPAGTGLVLFIALSSQYLFYHIDPGPLNKHEAYIFNGLVACQLVCWWRTCLTDPGRIPKDWHTQSISAAKGRHSPTDAPRHRWCRKCEAYKPPRSHHCKSCKRCIPKMDHHCVWTANCVSHITLAHFVRFLIYGVAAMIYLESFFFERGMVLWKKRHLPSYLGPTAFQFGLLFILIVMNSALLFMLGLLLGRTLWSLALNVTTIESWEIERHEALLRRARVLDGHLVGPDGKKVRIERQEFPWDIGIWKNICQAFNSSIPLLWLWPLAPSPAVDGGLAFEHNEIEDPGKPWPPPDPDRMFRTPVTTSSENTFTKSMDVDNFRRRQLADFLRYTDIDGEYVVRRRPFHERLEATLHDKNVYGGEQDAAYESDGDEPEREADTQGEQGDRDGAGGEEAWRNQEGERLGDFGVDEVAEFYDEDDVPLGELYGITA